MFRNLDAEITRSGTNLKEVSKVIKISYDSMINKTTGKNEFKLSEMETIRDRYFQNMSLDYLFQRVDLKNVKIERIK